MANDRLWIWTALAGSIFGTAFVFYIHDTRIGLWSYGLFDKAVDYIRDKFNLTWLNQDADAWRKINPNLSAKIDQLEERIKQLEEFDKTK